jgi:hypothetical protein
VSQAGDFRNFVRAFSQFSRMQSLISAALTLYTTIGWGATFASLRGDRVIAVDANPDLGTVAQRGPNQIRSTVRSLLLGRELSSLPPTCCGVRRKVPAVWRWLRRTILLYQRRFRKTTIEPVYKILDRF